MGTFATENRGDLRLQKCMNCNQKVAAASKEAPNHIVRKEAQLEAGSFQFEILKVAS